MHGLVPRFKRTGLIMTLAVALGLGVSQDVTAQTAGDPELTFQPQPEFFKFKKKARLGKPLRVAFLGGSITAGATTRPRVDPANRFDFSEYNREQDSWRAQVFRKLKTTFETYPKQLKMINASLSSTGSMVGAFRYETDVAIHNPDLLIIEFAINDASLVALSSSPEADCSIQRSLLSIIEQARANNPDVAILIAVSPAKGILLNPDSPNAVSRAITIDAAIAFGVPYVDVSQNFFNEVLPPGIQAAHLYAGHPLQFGNSVHPSPIGHDVYADAVIKSLTNLFRFDGFWFPAPRIALPTDLEPFPKTPKLYAPLDIPAPDGFTPDLNAEDWNRHPIFAGKDALFTMDTELTLDFPFNGSAAAIWWEWDYDNLPIHGKFQVLVDGNDLGVFSSHPDTSIGEQRLPRFQVVGEGLDPLVQHNLQLVIPKYQPQVMPNVLNLALIGIYVDQD